MLKDCVYMHLRAIANCWFYCTDVCGPYGGPNLDCFAVDDAGRWNWNDRFHGLHV